MSDTTDHTVTGDGTDSTSVELLGAEEAQVETEVSIFYISWHYFSDLNFHGNSYHAFLTDALNHSWPSTKKVEA